MLTGPAGTAKTTTIRILAKELDFEISEWSSSIEETYTEGDYERQSNIQKFETFLSRAKSCRTLVGTDSHRIPKRGDPQPSCSSRMKRTTRQIVLLEDIPNILHRPTQEAFHTVLENFVTESSSAPLVIIISDTSTRGEARDESIGGGSYFSSHDTVNIRSILPSSLLHGPFVTQIVFNPVAPTLMLRALQHLFEKTTIPSQLRPTKEELNMIVETSNGDIRSAIMALQIAYSFDGIRLKPNTKSRSKKVSSKMLVGAITRREQALALFHLMGKILYNKRKGDPPSSSATAREKLQERERDLKLKDPPPIQPWLSEHRRRASRIDVDDLYSDSPIDTGLFSLYVHQNYTQFCDEIEECSDLSGWLSWIDSSGGEQWYQANPHQFHLLTLGTLHSLPSPVARRGQKLFKPEFFETLNKTREIGDAVNDVWSWLRGRGHIQWSRSEIATEMGTILKLKSQIQQSDNDSDIPRTHSLFSSLPFAHTNGPRLALLEDVDEPLEPINSESQTPSKALVHVQEIGSESWLANDDIEEF